ncbi:hypothetical protein GETHLI_33140 [Geothrix limicola]|uniref:FecR protein domain-containing protein n=1 Tax=Geothrix limicola TaxID=2927978 RepID=A0ABQ5QIV0_9BACT|nr:DUF6600 domain-containing protein [Geothrix limicola]GLH74812.1 hypothetical protein GETHLI_33140 [Geothrix limicola]
MNATFTQSRLAALLLPAAILAAAPQAPQPPAAPEDDETYQGESPERYAMVRALEGDVTIRKGDIEESLSRGTPIAEGDVVESRGRGVLQLGDGTRVAFGGATRFSVAALFTDRKGEKQVLLRLDYGRLRVLLGGQSDARFRVDTPSGTATCFDKGAFTVEAERDKLVRLKVHSGRVTFTNERDEARIAAGERLTVYSPQDGLDRVRGFNTYDGDDFDRWSDRAVIVHRGESWDHVPAEIRYYADDLDNHGRWINSDEFGWVWQPNGVAEDWRPYYEGRWAPYAGGMTWVSDEPWGYIAYHHGRWHWSVGVGWCWIPGVYYSPAWVAWNHTPGYCGWAPLGYYNTPCHWGYGAWRGGYAWNVVSINFINAPRIHTRVYTDVHVIGTFNGPGGGPRDLRAPWQRSPLIVSRTEFHNPGQFQNAFQRDVNRERMRSYELQARNTTGREIFHRELSRPNPVDSRPGSPVVAPVRRPFEERRNQPVERFAPRERPIEQRPVEPRPGDPRPPIAPRPEPRRPDQTQPQPSREIRPEAPRPTPRIEERRPDNPPVRDRFENRRPVEERRPEPRPVEERRPEPRPMEERRPDPVRERSPEPRPRIDRMDREERRPEPMRPVERESRPAPRPEPARESRPAPRQEPAHESRPAPRPEPAKERPREEKKSR